MEKTDKIKRFIIVLLLYVLKKSDNTTQSERGQIGQSFFFCLLGVLDTFFLFINTLDFYLIKPLFFRTLFVVEMTFEIFQTSGRPLKFDFLDQIWRIQLWLGFQVNYILFPTKFGNRKIFPSLVQLPFQSTESLSYKAWISN